MGKRPLIVAVIFFIVLLAVPATIANFYRSIDTYITSQKVNQIVTQTDLTATAVKIKIDNFIALDQSIASLASVQAEFAAGNWNGAAATVRDLENNPAFYNPDIDRMVIYSADAIQEAAYPELTGAIGVNYSTSTWYNVLKTTSATSAVNGVTQRVSVPRIQVVNIAVPVHASNATVGYLVFQIPASTFGELGTGISLGTYGLAYIVDQNGNLVFDPHQADADSSPENVAQVPVVANALRGGNGTTLSFDPLSNEESVVSYQSVPVYNWAVVTQEPYEEVFDSRDGILSLIGFGIIATFFIDLFLSYAIWGFMKRREMMNAKKPTSTSTNSVAKKTTPRRRASKKGFTLIELLVVIAIIAVLAVVVILSLNPAELLRQARDSNRISDLSTIKTALSLYLVDATSPNLASSTGGYANCYLSTFGTNATTTAKCGVFSLTYATDTPATSTSYRKADSTGWIPVNFSQLSFGSPFGSLPVDPSNNLANYYAYAATSSGYSFELDTFMESKKFGANGASDVITTDGGDNNGVYEVGNKNGLNL